MDIVKMLPRPLQHKFQELAQTRSEHGKALTFQDLSNMASSFIGKAIAETSKPVKKNFGFTLSSSKPRIYSVQSSKNTDVRRPLKSSDNSNNHEETKISCPDCNQPHPLWKCSQFIAKSIQARWKVVRRQPPTVCFNCLGINYTSKECRCQKK